jgi:hypothetical protein
MTRAAWPLLPALAVAVGGLTTGCFFEQDVTVFRIVNETGRVVEVTDDGGVDS